MSNIIDVDFSLDPKYTFGMKSMGDHTKFCRYADENIVIPETDWKALAQHIQDLGVGNSSYVTRIYNQKQEGSCVANASSQATEIVQARQFGKNRVVHLSAMSLYKRIGSGPSSGAVVSDAIEELVKDGVLPLDNEENKARFKHFMPNTGWSTPYPEGWKETAKNFKALEWMVCDSYAELISALLFRYPVVVGRQGHSICYCDVVYKDGEIMVKYANSWGDWGENGFGYDTLRTIKAASGWAYALRSVVAPTFQV